MADVSSSSSGAFRFLELAELMSTPRVREEGAMALNTQLTARNAQDRCPVGVL